jgi:hypothetical protein
VGKLCFIFDELYIYHALKTQLILSSIKKAFCFLAFIILGHQYISAQHITNPIASLHDHKEFIIGIDNRITKINDKFGVIYGIYSGLGYGENLRFKFSISGTPFEIGKFSKEKNVNEVSRLAFVSVGQEFDFFTAGRFKLITYLNGGFGYHFYRILDHEKVEVSKGREYIWPLELGLHGRYQLNPLIALKTGVGRRFVFPEESKQLSGYYIKLTLVVNPKKLKTYFRDRKEKKRASNN